MTTVPQHYPLFVIYLGANGKDCRVFPGVFAVTGWRQRPDGDRGEPLVVALADAEDPGDEAFTRRFFHSYEAASAYIAEELATPPHPAGH
ncbi:hypothetical protein AMIS_19670 [Actinoplanes missouriensis 431]|uniref:Uncharacterized protein n=1 Tax=Actinoplanes missouriensis (strain ATCC 14538 / DSM 43046 / CBS 188.64 / JCM 3121 / NBRC 102363 / NCIMB 12654 / NRRL B-3342 / UNCC 431) TaxID=512565 RepID=I0H2F0_ACTM4|nr:hypothetical protein [Actinoplanes missouriensis]BAL87187.1 hypothetical protein AMIS_19670 [Actinoplanes missouriensis 431]